MARTTIGEVISRVRNQLKAVKSDAFLTDRFIYSLISKHAKWLMKREDGKNKVLAFSSIFQTLDYVELIEIDKVEAQCTGIKSGITFKRTKAKIPTFMQGYYGPLIRAITSIDGSQSMQPTTASTYLSLSSQKNFKYNNTKYFWFLNDYLYFPNVDWDAVKIEAVFEDSIGCWNCDPADDCNIRQLEPFNVPDYLHGEIESNVMKDFGITLQIPSDISSDKQSSLR
jgi:hypothetical protein